MASIRIRGKYYHIFYYDPFLGKQNSRSTKITVSKENYKRALRFANEYQCELDNKKEEMKSNNVNVITIAKAFERFKSINSDKHPKTIKDYERFYSYFTQMFNPQSLTISLNKNNVEEWFFGIKRLEQKKNSIHALGKQCIHFLNFLFEYSFTKYFKINKDVRTKPEVSDIITLSDEDIKIIFDNLVNKCLNIKALIYLALYSGLRSSDMINIKIENIDLERIVWKYYSPKRKMNREIPFHSILLPIIKNVIGERKQGQLLNYRDVESLGRSINRYFELLKIKDKGYSARTFRKTFITLCRNRFRIEMPIVQELVGHQHTSIMDRHYNSYDIETLRGELEKFNLSTILKSNLYRVAL